MITQCSETVPTLPSILLFHTNLIKGNHNKDFREKAINFNFLSHLVGLKESNYALRTH